MKKKLRIGFIVPEHLNVPAWYAETINLVAQEKYELFLLRTEYTKPSATWPAGLRLFRKFEDIWFDNQYDASKIVFLSALSFSGELRIQGNYFQPGPDQLNALKALNLDLIFSTNLPEKNETLSGVALFGLWFIQFGFGMFRGNSLPAFWEVMMNSNETGSYLVMRKSGKDFILYEGTTLTVPYSAKNNFNSIAWRSASYLMHRARTLSLLYESFEKIFPDQLDAPAGPYALPSNIFISWLFLRNNMRYFQYKWKSKSPEGRFTLLFSKQSFEIQNFTQTSFEALPLSGDIFMADPFVIEDKQTHYIFFEEYLYSKSRAHISVMEYTRDGGHQQPVPILEKPYHLSYPFVFKWEEQYYMVPESSSNGTVDLYKALSFPYKWKFLRHLMEHKNLIDATLFFHEKKWWLFANGTNHPFTSTNDQLFLFYADDLLSGDWTSHPKNPIVTHIGNCRPAGRIFRREGKIFRPAQNNASQQYGYGIRINEIEVLTEWDYREKEVRSIDPEILELKAIHHLDFTDSLVVVDGIR